MRILKPLGKQLPVEYKSIGLDRLTLGWGGNGRLFATCGWQRILRQRFIYLEIEENYAGQLIRDTWDKLN